MQIVPVLQLTLLMLKLLSFKKPETLIGIDNIIRQIYPRLEYYQNLLYQEHQQNYHNMEDQLLHKR